MRIVSSELRVSFCSEKRTCQKGGCTWRSRKFLQIEDLPERRGPYNISALPLSPSHNSLCMVLVSVERPKNIFAVAGREISKGLRRIGLRGWSAVTASSHSLSIAAPLGGTAPCR